MSERICGTAPNRTATKNAHAHAPDAASSWTLEPHVCRVCFSRLASKPLPAGGRLYQCTNCGLEAEGCRASALCACGTKIRRTRGDGRGVAQLVDAGIRCVPNPNKTPEFPALFIAKYLGSESTP